MVKCKCIEKKRNKQGVIKSYILEDFNGRRLEIDAKQLKFAIFSNQLEVINLKLTTDGKLVDKNNLHSEVGGIGHEIHISEHATVDRGAFVGSRVSGVGTEIHIPKNTTVDKRAFEYCESTKVYEQDKEVNNTVSEKEYNGLKLLELISRNFTDIDNGYEYADTDISEFYKLVNNKETIGFNLKYLGKTNSGHKYFCYNNFIFETNTHYILRSCGTVENYIKRHSEVYGKLNTHNINSKALKVIEDIRDVCNRYSVDVGFDFRILKDNIDKILHNMYEHIDPKVAHIVNKENIRTTFVVNNITNPTIKFSLMCDTNINGIMYSINLIDIKLSYNFREFGYHLTLNTCKTIRKSGVVVSADHMQIICDNEYIDSVDKLHSLLNKTIILMDLSLVKGLQKYI